MRSRAPVVVLLAALAATASCGRKADQRAAPEPAPVLSAAERAGEAIFRRETCGRCHTLFDAPPPSGPVTLPLPQPPSGLASRVGPDLGLEGHRRSDDWQYAHLYAPEILSPGSRMPAFRHLFRTAGGGAPEPLEDARRLVAWLQTLGRARRDVWAEFRARDPVMPAPSALPDAARLERGAALYAEHCAACHGVDGDGRGPAASLLSPPPRDFTSGAYRFRSNGPWDPPLDSDLFRTVTIGTGTGAAMPAFYFLGAEDRWALVLRIKAFAPAQRGTGLRAGPAAPAAGSGVDTAAAGPDLPADAAAVEAGRALWTSLGCARCHGDDAAGRSALEAGAQWTDAGGGTIARSGDLRHACARRGGGSDAALERAIRWGVGAAMPSFGDAVADSPGMARSIRAYVESLGRPAEPATR